MSSFLFAVLPAEELGIVHVVFIQCHHTNGYISIADPISNVCVQYILCAELFRLMGNKHVD